MISFCTVCCDRVENLKLTYIHNIEQFPEHEFILLNYGDKTYLDEWVGQNLAKYENFNYYKTYVEYYHMAKAWNLSFRLATGDFLFLMTCDVKLDKEIVDECGYCLASNSYIGDPYSREIVYGFSRCNFCKTNGFDETFEGHGLEDTDLASRLKMLNCAYFKSNSIEVLDHPNELRFGRYRPGDIEEQNKYKREKIAEHKRFNTVKVNDGGFEKHFITNNFGGVVI